MAARQLSASWRRRLPIAVRQVHRPSSGNERRGSFGFYATEFPSCLPLAFRLFTAREGRLNSQPAFLSRPNGDKAHRGGPTFRGRRLAKDSGTRGCYESDEEVFHLRCAGKSFCLV